MLSRGVNNQLFPVRALLHEGVSKGNWLALERTNLLLTRSRTMISDAHVTLTHTITRINAIINSVPNILPPLTRPGQQGPKPVTLVLTLQLLSPGSSSLTGLLSSSTYQTLVGLRDNGRLIFLSYRHIFTGDFGFLCVYLQWVEKL